MKKKILKFEIFYENHHPTRHIKYKGIVFAPCNKPIIANKLWNDFYDGLTLRLRVNSAKYIAR